VFIDMLVDWFAEQERTWAGCRYLGLLIRRKLKEFKRAAVRSDKTGRSFSAMIHLAAAPCGDITRPRRVDLFGASIGQVLPPPRSAARLTASMRRAL
jgi:hypothetical protein